MSTRKELQKAKRANSLVPKIICDILSGCKHYASLGNRNSFKYYIKENHIAKSELGEIEEELRKHHKLDVTRKFKDKPEVDNPGWELTISWAD